MERNILRQMHARLKVVIFPKWHCHDWLIFKTGQVIFNAKIAG